MHWFGFNASLSYLKCGAHVSFQFFSNKSTVSEECTVSITGKRVKGDASLCKQHFTAEAVELFTLWVCPGAQRCACRADLTRLHLFSAFSYLL